MTAGMVRLGHDEIAELLPDYILGALPDADLDLVAHHLGACDRCRREYEAALETSSLLFDAGPVNPAIRGELTGRLSPGVSTRVWPVAATPLVEVARSPVSERTQAAEGWRPTPMFGRVGRQVAALAAAAILALGGWGVVTWLGDDGDDLTSRLTGEPSFAHYLTDTGTGSDAEGVMYVDPAESVAFVTASDLAPLAEGYGYQVWLFTESGQQVSGGFLSVDADGDAAALVTAPEAYAAYVAVGLSAEPLAGSAAPTGPLALGGWIR